MNDLPDYTIRYSRRAKYIRLSICPQKGLEVVLPVHAHPDEVPHLLYKKRNWINKHLKSLAAKEAPCLPETIYLQANQQNITVVYQPAHGSKLLYQYQNGQFILGGNTHSQPLVQQALVQLLREQAHSILGARLVHLAQQHGYSFEQVKIRAQKSRWGSCSSRGNISLNYKLLFLPPSLCDYVLLHELCHTKYLNHSAAFWQQLEKTLPGCRTLDKQMKTAQQYIPAWLDYPFKEQH